jgi:hypothetical protein
MQNRQEEMQKRMPSTKKDLSIHKEGDKMLTDYLIIPLIIFFIIGMIIIITYETRKVITKNG